MLDDAAPNETRPQDEFANDPPTANAEAAIGFLRRVKEGGPWRLTFICPDKERRPDWWPNRKRDGAPCGTVTRIVHTNEEIAQFVGEGERDRLNCYFTPNRSTVRAARKLRKHEITQLAWLHVDSDPRSIDPTTHTPQQCAAHYAAEMRRLLDEVRAFEPAPTVVVCSGGGLNILWRAAQPLDLSCTQEDVSEAVEAERWSRHLQSRFICADDTHNVDRVLRLPGTINWPDAKKLKKGRRPALAYVALANWEATVDLASMPKEDTEAARGVSAVAVRVNPSVRRQISGEQIEALPISDRAKAAIVAGPDKDQPLKGDNSGSGWTFFVLCELARAGVDDQTMFDIITDPDLGISAHVLREGAKHGKLQEYAERQIRRAKERAAVDGVGTVPFTEDHLADTLVASKVDELRYCAAMGRWLRWDETRWIEDSTLHVFDLARQVARAAAKRHGDDDPAARRLSTAKTVAAIERLSQSDRRVSIEASAFDSDAMILNTPAGIVDLRTGALLPHDPTRYCTRTASVGPAEGEPVQWLKYLHDVTASDAAYIDYLQRVAGYCLTGQTVEHALFFLHGPGGNGKTVFSDVLLWLLGDYSKITPFNTLVASEHAQHPTDLADLRGARLVTSVETEQGQRWAESKIKLMTGGDMIKARFMRQDFFEYRPQFKLLVVGNHKPGFSNVDQAIRRRIHLLPFTVQIANPDKHLKERLKEQEGGRILSWAIRGCLQWQSAGLQPPAIVTNSTDTYLHGQDTLAQWLAECTEAEVGATQAMADLFESWSDWCRAGREETRSKRWLADRLEDRGFHRRRGAGNVALLAGLRLASPELTRLVARRQAQLDEAQARRALLVATGMNATARYPDNGQEPPF